MIKEPKNINFITTGRQPSTEEFGLISEWIQQRKLKVKAQKLRENHKRKIEVPDN
jgi:hypothetical protein